MYRALLKEIKFWSSSLERKEIGANTVKPANKKTDLLNGEEHKAAYRMFFKKLGLKRKENNLAN